MAKSNRMTNFTEGSIPRHLIFFSVPMLIGNLLQALYNTIDSIWVGQFLGASALAAVSVSFPIIFSLIALIIGITMATTTLVAQYYGADEPERVRATIANSMNLLTVFGGLVSIFGVLFRRNILQLINVPADVMEPAASYLGVFLAGIIPMFLYNVVGAILRGLGDSKTPLKFLAYATVLNIILDPIMIFGIGPIPHLGVAGAAWATVIAQAFSAVLSIRYLVTHTDLMEFRGLLSGLDWEITKLTFRIGLPAGIQQILVSLSGLAVAALVNRFGSAVVAAFGVGQRIDQFAIMPAMSIGVAVSALVGQNLGAGKDERVREIVTWSTRLGAGITGVVMVLVLLGANQVIKLFSVEPQVIQAGVEYLKIVAFSYVPLALMFTLSGVLRGAGDTVPTMLITLVSLWIVRVPLASYLSSLPTLGAKGVFYGFTLSPMAGLLGSYLYYRSGRWRRATVSHQKTKPKTAE